MKDMEYLKAIIRKRNISIKELSIKTGIKYSTLLDLLSKDVPRISINNFLSLCEALELDPYDVLEVGAPVLTYEESHLLANYRVSSNPGRSIISNTADFVARTLPRASARPYIHANAQPGATMPALADIDEELSAAYHGHGEHDLDALNEDVSNNDDPA